MCFAYLKIEHLHGLPIITSNVAGELEQRQIKGAGYSDSLRKTTEELSGMGTSRHPKVLQSGPNHGANGFSS